MTTIPIYTIGYGNRSIEEFVGLLQKYDIKFLADIRSQPYSRYNPDFSKDALERRLKQASIRYIFMGDTLGGRPRDDTSYQEDGRVDYEKVAEKDFYQKGISYLHIACTMTYKNNKPSYQMEYRNEESRSRYRRAFSIKYVGFSDPIYRIPAGSLVRVSLARWWVPSEADEERCYLQLSGWFL